MTHSLVPERDILLTGLSRRDIDAGGRALSGPGAVPYVGSSPSPSSPHASVGRDGESAWTRRPTQTRSQTRGLSSGPHLVNADQGWRDKGRLGHGGPPSPVSEQREAFPDVSGRLVPLSTVLCDGGLAPPLECLSSWPPSNRI